MSELTLDKFGEIIDDFLTKNYIQMLVEMPKGTQNVTIIDNTEAGPVIHFYILLKALPAVFKKLAEMIDINPAEDFIDTTLGMVKSEILEVLKDETVGEESKK